jgi:hypothetical protein
MFKTVLLLLFVIILGCAPKVNYSFTVPIPITYEEERTVADKYPIEPIHQEQLNAE